MTSRQKKWARRAIIAMWAAYVVYQTWDVSLADALLVFSLGWMLGGWAERADNQSIQEVRQ